MAKQTVEAPECGIRCPGQPFSCDTRGYHFTDAHGDRVHIRTWTTRRGSRVAQWTTSHPEPVWQVSDLAPAR